MLSQILSGPQPFVAETVLPFVDLLFLGYSNPSQSGDMIRCSSCWRANCEYWFVLNSAQIASSVSKRWHRSGIARCTTVRIRRVACGLLCHPCLVRAPLLSSQHLSKQTAGIRFLQRLLPGQLGERCWEIHTKLGLIRINRLDRGAKTESRIRACDCSAEQEVFSSNDEGPSLVFSRAILIVVYGRGIEQECLSRYADGS